MFKKTTCRVHHPAAPRSQKQVTSYVSARTYGGLIKELKNRGILGLAQDYGIARDYSPEKPRMWASIQQADVNSLTIYRRPA